jgi:dihydroorotate dehydrogenase (NAD+) catalytic subunit
MWLDEDALIRKRDLVLDSPFVNAPGFLGFAPDPQSMPFLSQLGAFITNPISQRPRQPAHNRSCIPYPGGFLLHTGWPNPGLRRAIGRYQRAWANAPLPVIVHLLVENPLTLEGMVRQLEALENLLAVELGLPPECNAASLSDFLEAATGELPIIISLSPQQMPAVLETLLARPPAALHLQPLRGSIINAAGDLISGRLYGPAAFPLTLQAVRDLSETSLRVIAGGGVLSQADTTALLSAGAFAVELDAALWGANPSDVFS